LNRQESGIECFRSGFNCAQAVFSAFCQDYGLEPDIALRIAGGLGSGARSADTCGALSGAILVIGLRHGQDTSRDKAAKELCNSETEKFSRLFREKNGSSLCRELLHCDITTEEGRKFAVDANLFTTKCVELVVDAIMILEDMGY
jgi:C_GCAxxG_C_C family probable redox protein